MGKQTLGGSIFCYNAISQDYCLKEAVDSLKELCDEVVVLDAGSIDGSVELVKSFEDSKTKVVCLPNEEWVRMKGREKLSHFSNIAKSFLNTEWHFCLQSDEVLDEGSFDTIRGAIEQPGVEGYWVKRINMWADSKHYLDVPDDRKPVGTEIIRLAKIKYWSVDDAQSINVPSDLRYLNRIKIYHMGFIRSKYVHTKKIKHMLEEVFLMGGNDPKVEGMGEVFDCWGMGFDKSDVKTLIEPLPKFVSEWATKRDEINQFKV